MTNEAASLEQSPAGRLLVCATVQRWLEPQALAGGQRVPRRFPVAR